MTADLLDRSTTHDVGSPRLRRHTRVRRVFAARNRPGAWAYLAEVGWRKVSAPTPAATRDLLAALCRARLSGAEVAVELTGTAVVAVTDGSAGDQPTLLAGPRFTGLTGDRRRPPSSVRG